MHRMSYIAFDRLRIMLYKRGSIDGEVGCLAKRSQSFTKEGHVGNTRAMFTGSFDQDCQQKSVPKSLLALVDMIHNGPNIADQTHLMHVTSNS